MTAKRFYQSPETETIVMPLEGGVCITSGDTVSSLHSGNPFSGNTETVWGDE